MNNDSSSSSSSSDYDGGKIMKDTKLTEREKGLIIGIIVERAREIQSYISVPYYDPEEDEICNKLIADLREVEENGK